MNNDDDDDQVNLATMRDTKKNMTLSYPEATPMAIAHMVLETPRCIYVPGSINSHYFHIIGDKLINPIVGVYIPIIRIPIKGGMTIPNIATFDRGTYIISLCQTNLEHISQIYIPLM